jgi:all-trans-retinol dehydrogenase (NAD+)
MVQEFMPAMLAKNKGHIVGLASMASWVTPPGMVDYAATKAAVQAFHEGKPVLISISAFVNWFG